MDDPLDLLYWYLMKYYYALAPPKRLAIVVLFKQIAFVLHKT